jgi:hypothetical protein
MLGAPIHYPEGTTMPAPAPLSLQALEAAEAYAQALVAHWQALFVSEEARRAAYYALLDAHNALQRALGID